MLESKGRKKSAKKRKINKNLRIVFGLILVFVVLLGMASCGKSQPISSEEFQKEMEELGYEVTDLNSQYADYDHILEARVIESKGIHAEFFEIDTVENCIGVYETNKKTVEEKKTEDGTESYEEKGDYQNKAVITPENHYVLIRVNKTMIYGYSDTENTKELEKIVKSIKY